MKNLLALYLAMMSTGQVEPVRFMLHGNMSHELPTEEYLRFVEEARPDILIMGVFDQRLYALAAPGAKSKKPGLDVAQHLEKWQAVATRLRAKNIRLVGQMELFVVSDRPAELAEQSGWFGFYESGWNTGLLGKRPSANVVDLLAKGVEIQARSDKTALCGCRVNTKAILGCVNNPAWREAQKRMVDAAVRHGVGGFLTNRNFFEHCDCAYCQEAFRRWLGAKFSPQELKERFHITTLATHRFGCVNGTYRVIDDAPGELHLEKLRFIKDRVRDFFDEIYVKHGRKLRKDLLLGQWNHQAYFDELHLDRGHLPVSTRTTLAHGLADERWGMPASLWGAGEDLIWYCNWGTTQNTILAKEYAGDTVLYGLYNRALARGKAYVINKYDFYRPRVMMAEAAALGYATNAIATPWQHPEDRAVVLKYFHFLREQGDLYKGAERVGEIGLIFPRRALHAGDASALEYTEAAGRTLIREHFLFDMIPDDLLCETKIVGVKTLIIAAPEYLRDDELKVLHAFSKGGGKIIWTPVAADDRVRTDAVSPAARRLHRTVSLPEGTIRVENARTQRKGIGRALAALGPWSGATAPWTVEWHTYRQNAKKRWVVHLVNYNHKENAPGKSVVEREAPMAAEPVQLHLWIGKEDMVRRVRFLSPDDPGEHAVRFRQMGPWLNLTVPKFLVYGVCVVDL